MQKSNKPGTEILNDLPHPGTKPRGTRVRIIVNGSFRGSYTLMTEPDTNKRFWQRS